MQNFQEINVLNETGKKKLLKTRRLLKKHYVFLKNNSKSSIFLYLKIGTLKIKDTI